VLLRIGVKVPHAVADLDGKAGSAKSWQARCVSLEWGQPGSGAKPPEAQRIFILNG